MRAARRVALAGIFASAVLATLNIVVGLLVRSTSVLATGVEFAGDVLASTAVWLGMIVAVKPADADHPYRCASNRDARCLYRRCDSRCGRGRHLLEFDPGCRRDTSATLEHRNSGTQSSRSSLAESWSGISSEWAAASIVHPWSQTRGMTPWISSAPLSRSPRSPSPCTTANGFSPLITTAASPSASSSF